MDIAELYRIADAERARRKPRRIRCCTAAGCQSSGAEAVMKSLENAIAAENLTEDVEVSSVGCLRFCGRGPLVAVDPEQVLYEQVTVEDAPSFAAGCKGGVVTAKACDTQHPFFVGQQPIVLENSGQINPERIEEYIAVGGYEALYQVLYDMTPASVVAEITQSGLRDGGAAAIPRA
jgi:bidirectional [NiFe] hydrogenase diaphorase subunit